MRTGVLNGCSPHAKAVAYGLRLPIGVPAPRPSFYGTTHERMRMRPSWPFRRALMKVIILLSSSLTFVTCAPTTSPTSAVTIRRIRIH